MDDLFSNVGSKLKRFARGYFAVTTTLLVVGGLIAFIALLLEEETALLALIVLFGIPFIIFVNLLCCWVLHAFGSITEKHEDVPATPPVVPNATVIKNKPQATKPATPVAKSSAPAVKASAPPIKTEFVFDEGEGNPFAADAEFIDVRCPQCKEDLSFVVGTKQGMCPSCGAKFEL